MLGKSVLAPPEQNVCNDKGCLGVLEGLLILAAGRSIVAAEVWWGNFCCWEVSYCWEASTVE